MTQQSNNLTDPNWFMRELAPNDYRFSFLDFYGWTVVLRTPWMELPHIDSFDDGRPWHDATVIGCATTITLYHPPVSLGLAQTVRRDFLHESVVNWLKRRFEVRDV